MKEQALRTFANLSFLLATIVAVSFLMAVAGASSNAQAQSVEKMVINIPFDFSVRDRNFPAGEYIVKRASPNGTSLQLETQDRRTAIFILPHGTLQDKAKEDRGKLVFNKYADLYFLSEVWMTGDGGGRHIPMSRTERSLRRELARQKSQPQQVTTAAHR